ncbi:glycosyltransferase [Pseudolysobacter antarcticus]|uniref:Glycosyltransferase n=1 Tax=Pseudolysobacter antarcticus TaxID=2511995 RepID=A0A411HHF8_9GAMM|nr:glycosyltransferase [Pseudolysobacter antarcticus]QBB69956.1 glycosyltransferase [Pseudolysobacter antarcticus]
MNISAIDACVASISPTRPLISVLTRSLNRPELARALQSVVEQSYRPLEVVVVAAGAEPFDLPEIDRGDVSMRLVSRGKPLAMSAAANVALDEARGEFLIFLDDDDYFLPPHIEGLYTALSADRDAVLAYSSAILENNAGEFTGLLSQPVQYSPRPLHNYNFISIHCALFPRRFARECRFDELLPLYGDWDFWLQISAFGRFIGTAQNTTCYRVESGTSGGGMGANANFEKRKIARVHIQKKHARQRNQLDAELREIAAKLDAAWQQSDFAKARLLCARSIALNGDQADILNWWALIAMQTQEWPLAEGLLRKSLHLIPNEPAALANFAQLYAATGELMHARVYAHLACFMQPTSAALRNLAVRLGVLD